MKKITNSVLAVVLSASFSVAYAQTVDTARTQDIEGVVVTALGVKREKKSIGYAAQEVKGDVISEAGQTNAISALSGNVAGLQVTAPSTMGGSSRIVMRGIGSVTGENRPLIVVDGVPLDNSNYNATNTQRGGGGRDFGDAAFDINPDDIESVTVLKGGPAAALYGARAGNGVIIYTTKSAKKGRTDITLNTGISLESVYIMPDLQTEYGGGFGLSEQVINGKTYNIADYAVDESWGPKYDPNLMYLPWYALYPELPDLYLKEVPWVAPEHDVRDFFRTGVSYNNAVSYAKSFTDSSLRFSYANNTIQGIFPNSTLNKNNFAITANTQLNEKLKAEGGINYVLTEGFNRPEQGYGDNSVAQKFFQWGQRQLDYSMLKNYKLPSGEQITWNRVAWDDPTPQYSDNPYWTAYENVSNDKRHRFFGNAGLTYNITKQLYAVGKVYGDTYNARANERVAIGSQAQPYFTDITRNFSEFNFESRLHFDTRISDDITLNTFVGANRRNMKYNSISGTTVGGLVIPNFYNLANSKEQARASNYDSWKRVNSAFGMASLGFKDMIFLEATGRNDWFSTVSEPIFYPSVTGSFVFSQAMKADWLSFGKLRLGWARVGNDTDPYRLETYVDARTPFLGNPRYSNPSAANNLDLKPEMKTTAEIGLEMRVLKNRLGLDVTLYDVKTNDLITPLEIDPATGFLSKWVNAGELQNKGVEATLFANPVKTEDFSWDMTVNFAKNDNQLNALYEDVTSLQLVNAPFRARLIAEVGQRYGQIYGTDYLLDANGNRIIKANGLYANTPIKALGSVVPDFNAGLRNSFRYKNFNASVLFDMQEGGKYFSTSHMWGMYSGMIEGTTANGIREDGIVLDGVLADGTKNTKVISAETFGAGHYNTVDAQNVFDASYVKLRELTLSYDLPKTFVGNLEGVKVSAFGRNLLTWGLAWKGMDPEMTSYGSGNIQGFEGGSLPSTRIYGFNVQVKF